ncbi:TraR/DksA family transcriptional regulator [Sinorhizobium terangae]|uniref:TraR/DksA family transcriptional regulator n=1 Tax=Sinorhizobium terangae TaxID=110322 RepID=A0A6N7LM96_SINTE|nr:TraR/DksA family transcriptional regulator [Sinorhizobium terangae]MBB4184973.1 RNA polymerase-binding transcription factor DksA [Sinorhizobium terangae]MQX18348.1 TraR/DksA family transcriptional regulator [Sinorhizobium terangae]WFU48434.1 TraR/DksA family transcriptional regulator [Sinorhizobium terangae]
MDKYALDDFREQLLRRKRELYGRLVKIEEDLDQPMNADVPDRVTERENDEVLEGLGLAGQSEIRAINAALDRIESGTFGICVRCGDPISPERLHAVPHAPLCQTCAAEVAGAK